MEHKCRVEVKGSEKTRVLARKKALRILTRSEMEKRIAERERTKAGLQTGFSLPQKRKKLKANDRGVQPSSKDVVSESWSVNEPTVSIETTMQETPQPSTNPRGVIGMDAMAMSHEFNIAPGPSRGSLFGAQNNGFPFESPSEVRGGLFYSSRSQDRVGTHHYQFPEGPGMLDQSAHTFAIAPSISGGILHKIDTNIYE